MWVVWIITLIVVGLATGGVFAYKQGQNNQVAESKANQVTALFARHGLSVPVDHETLIAVLGDNGGSVCDDPNSALSKALQNEQLANGGATVGSRPTRVDRNVVEGEALILQVYCPQQLPAFEKSANARHYYNVIRN